MRAGGPIIAAFALAVPVGGHAQSVGPGAPPGVAVPATPYAPGTTPAPTPPNGPPGPRNPPTAAPNAGAATGQSEDTILGLQIHPSLGVEEVFTDNARGTASGGNQSSAANGVTTAATAKRSSDLVTRVSPTLQVLDRTARLQLGLSYTPSYQKYAVNSDLDRFDHFVTGTVDAVLWPEHFTAKATTSISHEFINAQGALTAGGRAIQANETDVRTFTFTPTLKQAFGNFAIGQLQYSLGETSSDAIAPAMRNLISGSLISGPDFALLQWGLTVTDSETRQGSTPNAGQVVANVVNPATTASTSQRTAEVTTAYPLNRTFSLLSGFGYEEIRNGTLAQSPRGPFGNVGIGVTGSRTELHLLYNWRYGGRFVSADGSFELGPQLKAQLSYGETISTTQDQLISDAAGLQISPTGNFINGTTRQPFTPVNSGFGINAGLGNVAFRDRNGQLTITGTFDRNTYTLALLDNTRTSSTNFNESSIAVSAGYQRELSPDTRFNSTLGFTNIDEQAPIIRTDDIYSLSTGLSYQLGPTVVTSATYAFIYRHSTVPGQDVRENSLVLSVRKTF